NAFIFPGVGLGICVSRARRVTDGMFLDAAKALADKVTDDDLDQVAVYPELTRIRECSHAVACAAIKRAVAEGNAAESVLEDLEQKVTTAMWFPDYMDVRYEP
ncbi:MAG: malic enzyme-like NAD(P)-binding protein, partial [Gemmatimonadales bacterium]